MFVFVDQMFGTYIVTRVTRRVPLVEQELLTLSEHLISSPVCSGVRVIRSLVLICRSLFVRLSSSFWQLCCLVPLRFTDYDYPFGVFKLFLYIVLWSFVCSVSCYFSMFIKHSVWFLKHFHICRSTVWYISSKSSRLYKCSIFNSFHI
jgi:hypothetical protein